MDIKTSKALYPEHVFQVSAYAAMLEEVGYTVDGVRLLRVGRTNDEGFDDHIIGTAALRLGLKVFEAALDLYRAKQAFEKHEKALSPKPARSRAKKTEQEAA